MFVVRLRLPLPVAITLAVTAVPTLFVASRCCPRNCRSPIKYYLSSSAERALFREGERLFYLKKYILFIPLGPRRCSFLVHSCIRLRNNTVHFSVRSLLDRALDEVMAVCSSVVKTVVPDYSNGDCVKLCSEHYWPPKDENNQVYRHLPPTTDTVQTKPFPIRGMVFVLAFRIHV